MINMKVSFLFAVAIMWQFVGCGKSAAVQADSETVLDNVDTVDTSKPDLDKPKDSEKPVDSGEDTIDIDSDWTPPEDMDTDTSGLLALGFEWIEIEGGSFEMGSDLMDRPPSVLADFFTPEGPIHTVIVPTFKIGKTEVTVEQYKECVKAGGCSTPLSLQNPPVYALHCTPFENQNNLLYSQRSNHPVNCIRRDQMKFFCKWIGGRLPSESEWEYAAKSQGKDNTYPWGEAPVNCDLAIIGGCSQTTAPVCSKPSGNTEQGLCDMTGNVNEIVEDNYHRNYEGAPIDGSAWYNTENGEWFITRGGSYKDENGSYSFNLRTTGRKLITLNNGASYDGFRCAK